MAEDGVLVRLTPSNSLIESPLTISQIYRPAEFVKQDSWGAEDSSDDDEDEARANKDGGSGSDEEDYGGQRLRDDLPDYSD